MIYLCLRLKNTSKMIEIFKIHDLPLSVSIRIPTEVLVCSANTDERDDEPSFRFASVGFSSVWIELDLYVLLDSRLNLELNLSCFSLNHDFSVFFCVVMRDYGDDSVMNCDFCVWW
jgi:hypothetical protein